MKISKNILLAALLALQVALIAFLYRPGQHQAPPAAALLKDLSADSVGAITIVDGQGKSLALIKKDGWHLAEGEYPADSAKIDGLIKKLADMKSSRLVSQTPSSFARLKVADGDFNRKVTLEQNGKKIVFYLGTAPSSKSIHLRLAEAKEVYQINDLAAWEVLPEKESWWQAKYVNLAKDSLTGLTIANPQGSVELSHGDKDWRLAGKPDSELDNKRLEPLLSAVSEVMVASYLAKDFSPKGQPVATITYTAKEGAPVTLQIWAKDKAEDPDQVAKASSSPFYARIKAYGVKELLELKADSLLAKAPDTGAEPLSPAAAPAPPAAPK